MELFGWLFRRRRKSFRDDRAKSSAERLRKWLEAAVQFSGGDPDPLDHAPSIDLPWAIIDSICDAAIEAHLRMSDERAKVYESLNPCEFRWSDGPFEFQWLGRQTERLTTAKRRLLERAGVTEVQLAYQTDGTAFGATTLVRDPDGNLFIRTTGCDHEGHSSNACRPVDEAELRLRPDVWVKAMQLRGLASQAIDDELVRSLSTLMRSPERSTQEWATKIVATREAAWLRGLESQVKATDDGLVRSLLTLMRSPNRATQDWAVKALSSFDSPSLRQLVEAVAGDDPPLASVAARALTALGARALPAVPALVCAFSNCKIPAREAVLGVLSQIKHQDGPLKTIIDLAIRGYERDGLMSEARRLVEGRSDVSELVRLLSLALRQPDEAVRKAALLALYQLGRKASMAIPAVEGLLAEETNALIRRMANNALARMSEGV